MILNQATRFRLEVVALLGVLAGFVTAATAGHWFAGLDRAVYDGLLRLNPVPASPEIVIVGIDERSLERFGPWPWSRRQQAALFRQIGRNHPRAVLADVIYAGPTSPADDAALAAAAAALPLLAVPIMIDALSTGRQLVEVLPYPQLLAAADVLGHAHIELDPDAIARGTYLYQGVGEAHWPHLALALADALGIAATTASRCPPPAAPTIQNVRCTWVYTPFAGPPGSFAEVSAAEVLDGALPAAVLNDRLVLIGVTAAAGSDRLPSPLSGERHPMSGIELNANLLNGILQNALLTRAVWTESLVAALLCVLLPALWLPRLQPKTMLLVAGLTALVPVLVMALAQLIGQLHLPVMAASVAALVAYPYWSWRRHEIAWAFVAQEMSRVSDESQSWAFPHRGQDPGAVLDALTGLLKARWGWQTESSNGEDRLTLPDGRTVTLHREPPLSPAELSYARRVLDRLETPSENAEILPGERLAARIRRLQRAAEEVRAGRDVGLRGLAEMPNGVAVLSPVGEVLFVNQAARRLLSLPDTHPANYLELLCNLMAPLGRSWQDVVVKVVVAGEPVSFETRGGAGDSILFEAAPLAPPGHPVDHWVITVTDMSEVRAAEREREEALAFLSHDLRSPITSVLALVRDAGYSEVLADIGRYADKALSASEQFLQLSRVQARERFETYPMDVTEVVRNAVEHMFALAREAEVPVATDIPDDVDGIWVDGNGELLERAFVNLLSNAVKFSDRGQPVRVEIRRRENQVEVSVIDRGRGIPPDELERVFEPFFRSSVPALAERRGSGLGLRFVRTVVERHGGRIEAHSRVGEGSRFTVTLPVIETEPEAPLSA